MPLAPGTRLGAYDITAALGAGGMGEVYQGRDTRLDRTVAIKVITGALHGDADSRRRFEQEARAIAALNHPNICTIHDVGRQDDVDYLVMEYLEGETLADRLARGSTTTSGVRRAPLRLEEVFAIAIQIGDALDRAHRIGIVHRDLKPGNIMLMRRSGSTGAPDAKLLDFGLAAQLPGSSPLGQLSMQATMAPSMVATQAGARAGSEFSGTVQYMAPEQMEGQPADHRADIFSFGCVLYEMLSGRKAFEGANSMVVIAAVINSSPPPVPDLRTTAPMLDHLLMRCLEKDRERRWQSMNDVTGELRWIAEQPAATAGPAAIARSGSTTLWKAVAVVASVLALVVAVIWWAQSSRVPAPPSVSTLRFVVPTASTDDPTTALSPNGELVAYVANQNRRPMLWVRTFDSLENKVLPGTEGASYPFFSPDGRTIGFFADNKLKRVDLAGGAPLVLADAPNARGGAWGPGGVILYAPGVNAPIMKVTTSGGAPAPVTELNTGSGPSHRRPQFLSDGNRFIFLSTSGTTETNGVYLSALDKRTPVRLVQGDLSGRFAAPDRLLTVRQGALVAFPFDERAGTVVGEPAVIAQGFTGQAASGAFSTSDTGVLAYRSDIVQRRELVWVDRQGRVTGTVGEPSDDSPGSPELSPDERTVALFRQPKGDNDIWAIDLTRNLARPIVSGPPADAHPLWTPDGQSLTFTSSRLPGKSPLLQRVNGGPPALLLPSHEIGTPLSFSKDGRFILLWKGPSPGDLVAAPTGGAGQPIPVTATAADETEGQFAPDGAWVAYASNETGRAEVYVQSFPEGRARTQVSTGGGTQIRWAPDGKAIFFIAPDGRMMAAAIAIAGAAPQVQAPVALFQTHLATGINVLGDKPQYAVARDGRFLLNSAVEAATAPPIVVVVNWMKTLAR